jgi:hypothetical protein
MVSSVMVALVAFDDAVNGKKGGDGDGDSDG